MSDNVNHPDHYTFGDIECIDAIRAALGDEGFIAYCEGNAIKYLWRHRFKGGIESLEKAKWYLDRMIDVSRLIELQKPFDLSAEIDKAKKRALDGARKGMGFVYGERPKAES